MTKINDSGDYYTLNYLSLWSFTVLKTNDGYKLSNSSRYYGSDYDSYLIKEDDESKPPKGGLSGLNPNYQYSSIRLKFFLKEDNSKTIYFIDLYDSFSRYAEIRGVDLNNPSSNGFEYYNTLFRDYENNNIKGLYNNIDYYDNNFFYVYKNNNYIIQNGALVSNYVDNKIQIKLTNGSFYGVNIPEKHGILEEYQFIDDGVLLIFTYNTFFLKINTSCPKNQILNNQSSLTNIFNFNYDENLLQYKNSLFGLADVPEHNLIYLRDNYKKFIYMVENKYYLTTDITNKDSFNKIELFFPVNFLGKEEYFSNKKIVFELTLVPSFEKQFITLTYNPSAYNLLDIERSYTDEVEYSHDFSKVSIFDDKYWFYRSETEPNLIRYSYDTTGLYIPENSYDDIGDSSPITSIMQITDSYLGIFKENSAFTVTEDDETSDLYYVQTLKTELGNVPVGQTIVTSYTNNPLVINSYGIYGLGQNKNILETDSVFYSVTDKITSKYIKIKNKQNIKTHNHRFYTYFYYSENNITKIWVLDNRFNAWYYWELPLSSIDYIYDKVYDLDNADEVLTYIWSGNKLYMLTTSYYGILGNGNDSNLGASDIIGYQDYLNSDKGAYKRIEWYWKTPPLILQTINYLKKIVDMSMLFADAERETMYDSKHHKLIYGPGTDYKNNLELFYDIKTYRKKSMLLNSSYKGHIDYVSNARVKPRCQKCDFAALTLYNKIVKDGDNITYTYDNSNSDNEGYNNGYDIIDKLNLIGLTFKVVLS